MLFTPVSPQKTCKGQRKQKLGSTEQVLKPQCPLVDAGCMSDLSQVMVLKESCPPQSTPLTIPATVQGVSTQHPMRTLHISLGGQRVTTLVQTFRVFLCHWR